MRCGFAALLMLVSSVVTASAQGGTSFAAFGRAETRVSADDVIARLMQFDRNGDFKLALDELPERMQTLVIRGDRSDDLMLDAKEIRRLTGIPTQLPVLFESPQFGHYGFGDAFGTLSTRTHIDNTIDDLRLEPQAAKEAKRIGSTFVEELEREAVAKPAQLDDARRAALAFRLSGVLTDEERDNFRAALARRPVIKMSGLIDDVVHQLRLVEPVKEK